jgi:hypothetical protein
VVPIEDFLAMVRTINAYVGVELVRAPVVFWFGDHRSPNSEYDYASIYVDVNSRSFNTGEECMSHDITHSLYGLIEVLLLLRYPSDQAERACSEAVPHAEDTVLQDPSSA